MTELNHKHVSLAQQGDQDACRAILEALHRPVLATIYRHLGVDTEKQYIDHAGRPVPVLPFGEPIDELFS